MGWAAVLLFESRLLLPPHFRASSRSLFRPLRPLHVGTLAVDRNPD
jgi:hypothetical protein